MANCIGTLEGINSARMQAIDDGEVASRRVVRISRRYQGKPVPSCMAFMASARYSDILV